MENQENLGLVDEKEFDWNVSEEKELSLNGDGAYWAGQFWTLTFAV